MPIVSGNDMEKAWSAWFGITESMAGTPKGLLFDALTGCPPSMIPENLEVTPEQYQNVMAMIGPYSATMIKALLAKHT